MIRETGMEQVSLKSQELTKESLELKAVLTCAKCNRGSRERRA